MGEEGDELKRRMAIESLRALRGSGKGLWDKYGGGDAWLKMEREGWDIPESVERTAGDWAHSWTQTSLASYLIVRRHQWSTWPVVMQRVQVTPTRSHVADLCVVAGVKPDEQILTKPPHLCVEILSKDDTMSEMEERISDYLHFGVPYVWVIDPRTKGAYVFHGAERQEVTDGILRIADPLIEVPLSELFE